MWKFTQRSWVGGRLDKELMGRQDLAKYFQGASELKNFTVRKQGLISKRRGTELLIDINSMFSGWYEDNLLDPNEDAVRYARLIPFTYTREHGYAVLMLMTSLGGDFRCVVIDTTSGGVVNGTWKRIGGFLFPSEYGYVESDERMRIVDELNYLQSGNTLFITHRKVPPLRFVFDGTNLTIEKIDFGPPDIPSPTIASALKSGKWGDSDTEKTVSYVLTSVKDGMESLPSAPVDVTYKLPWGDTCKVTIEATGGASGGTYNLYKKDSLGYGLIASGDGPALVDDYITPDMSITPPSSKEHFSSQADCPSCIGLNQQRMILASTSSEPSKFWMSCVGDIYNFNVHDSIREDDAIEAEIPAIEFPNINHVVSFKDVMLFTDGGEWSVSPVSGNSLTYKTVSARMQSAFGCARMVKPILVGDEILFAREGGESILATRYNYATDGYESQDLTILSQWIFRNNGIVQMAYRQFPESTVECILKDGSVATLVYMKEHEVVAWCRWEFPDGWKAISVVSTKALRNGSTEIVYVVRRGTTYAIWRERDDTTVREDAPSALEHVCIDGMHEVGADYTAKYAEQIYEIAGKRIAGYPIRATMTTVRPEPQGDGGTIQFEIKNAKDFEARVVDSGNFTVRQANVPAALASRAGIAESFDGSAIRLSSTDVRKTLIGKNGTDGRVTVESDGIWPLNLLSLSVNYEIQPLSGSEG